MDNDWKASVLSPLVFMQKATLAPQKSSKWFKGIAKASMMAKLS